MSLFDKGKKNGGFMDEIRCDEPSYLIWKWHPSGVRLGEGDRENAIRWGSSLRVKDGEVAVFVYSQYDGITQEYIEGPCDVILNTANLPVLAGLVGLAYEGSTPFQAEVYFINLARIIQVKFGVPFFDVYDPRFSDFGVPVAVRGTVSFSIADYRTQASICHCMCIEPAQQTTANMLMPARKRDLPLKPTSLSNPITHIMLTAINYPCTMMKATGKCISVLTLPSNMERLYGLTV